MQTTAARPARTLFSTFSAATCRRVACGLLAAAAPLAQAAFTTLSLPAVNNDIRSFTDGATYSPYVQGTTVWNGVPFAIATDASGNNAFARGVLDIPVGVFGATQAYTLINSGFGAFGSNNGSVEFFGTGGSYYKVDLIQGTNIRDHFDNVFNNVIDGVTAIPALNVGAGRARLDEQIYNLPAPFASQTLTTIRFTGLDLGASGVPFIVAATVAVTPVPEPAALVLMAVGLLGVGTTARTRLRTR